MITTLHHRGPDGHAVLIDGQVGLAHARLAIVDIAGGAQPMCNETGDVWVTFNGEIFNHIELRSDLERRGHVFRTRSDTETIVHLYEQHDEDFVEHLNGQFAIGLWDARQRKLVLARDRVGIRPLVYTRVGDRFVFASESKALFALPNVRRAINPTALAQIFSLWGTVGTATPFSDIESLPPGHVMSVDAVTGRSTLRRYWDWSFDPDAIDPTRSFEECAEELRALLGDAVRLQLRADVPIGTYLSGGLDSSAITALIKRHSPARLRSFSLTFDDAEFDEAPFQLSLAAHLATDHSSIRVSHSDIARAFPKTVLHAEMPLVRTAPAPLLLLSQHVRASGYKVVLSGEGADEAFAGYDLFKEAKIRRFVARSPASKWRPLLLGRLYPYLRHSPVSRSGLAKSFFASGHGHHAQPWFAHETRITSTSRIQRFFRPELAADVEGFDVRGAITGMMPEGSETWSSLGRDQYVEAHTLLTGYLLGAQGDRVAMANSIEARVPFLDHRVIEFANRLPPHYKLRGLVEKVILKHAVSKQLPAEIRDRTKQPYRAPESACFVDRHGRLREETAELLSPSRLNEAGLFDPIGVGKLIAKVVEGRAIGFADNASFVGILSTMWLHEHFIRFSCAAPAQVRSTVPMN